MCFGEQETGKKETTSTANPAVSSAATQNLNFAQGLQNAGATAYGKPMVANFSPQQSESFAMADTIGQSPNWGTAEGYVNNAATAGPGSVSPNTIASMMDPYMSKYVQDSLAPQLEAQQQQFDTQNRGAAANSTMAGAFGNDSQDALYRSNLTQQQNIGRMGLIGQAYNNAFNTAIGAGAQDVANNLGAQTTNANLRETALGRTAAGATGLENLATAKEGATGLVNTMGQQQTAQEQAQRNADYQEFLRQQQYPFQTTELLNQTIGAGAGAMPASQTQTTSQPDNSGWQAAGTAAAMGAMMFLADGGELPAGQTAMVGERGPELAMPSMTPNVAPIRMPTAPAMPNIPMVAAPQQQQPQQPSQQQQPAPSNAPLNQLMSGIKTGAGLVPSGMRGSLGGLFGGGAGTGSPDGSVGSALSPDGTDFGAFGSSIGEMPMGFADGGQPPLDAPSIVGERGAELAVPETNLGAAPTIVGQNGPEIIQPDKPLTIIPHEALKAAAAKRDAKKSAPFDDVLGAAA